MSPTSSEPFFRDAGTGPGVVCLHANASTSAQWRGLIDLLAPTCRVLAPDLYGAGKSPEWSSDRHISLHDEAAFIEPVLARAGTPLALVGHSYGAAVALIAALAAPTRLRALVLYEPPLFSLLDAETPPPNEADEIRRVVREASGAVEAGDLDAAARRFIDYWMGDGSWEQMPEIEHFDLSPCEGDYTRCALTPRNGSDLRPRVFDLARERGWPVRELTRSRHTLEDIYVRLTRPEEEET